MVDGVAVVDADALIALILEKDPNHNRALDIASNLDRDGVELVFPDTVLPEAMTTLVRAIDQPLKAHFINKKLQDGEFHIEYIKEAVYLRAAEIFESAKSKKNTFFDAIVMAVAEDLGTKLIFSFDKWYPKVGFKLAS